MRNYLLLLLLSVFYSNIASAQNFHIFKGPTNSVGTMIVLLQEYGNNAYYYTLESTDYYSDMSDMSESDWKEFMREEKSNASYLQKSGKNVYTGRFSDRIVWNLRLTYDEYDKTARVVLSHPDYQSNTFNLSEVGLDGYKLAKQNRPGSSSSDGGCWVCHGKGVISMSYPFTGQVTCTNCGGTGKFNFSTDNTNSYNQGGNSYGGYVDSGSSTSSGSTSSGSHQCRVCNGTGSEIHEIYGGSGVSDYCNICRRSFSYGHYHSTCKTCKGTGRVSY